MFAPLPSPAEMSGWDRAAIDLGLPELLLMENASREALHVLSAETGQMPGKRVLLFMGGGNNGGDAACLARHLHDGGAEVLVLHTRPLGAYRGVTGQHVRLARRCGVAFAPAAGWPEKYRNTPWDVYADASVCERGGPDIVVDGILGTGFSGSLRPLELGLVARINALAQRAFIFSLDIPSGLSGLTGRPCPVAVRAHATVTFAVALPRRGRSHEPPERKDFARPDEHARHFRRGKPQIDGLVFLEPHVHVAEPPPDERGMAICQYRKRLFPPRPGKGAGAAQILQMPERNALPARKLVCKRAQITKQLTRHRPPPP